MFVFGMAAVMMGGGALVVAMAVASRQEAERQTKRLVRQPLRVLSRRRRRP